MCVTKWRTGKGSGRYYFDDEYNAALSDAERAAIADYKEYARKHLPRVQTLGGLWAPDFEPPDDAEEDLVDALQRYVEQTRRYSEVLVRAARLRQAHYEDFIASDPTRPADSVPRRHRIDR